MDREDRRGQRLAPPAEVKTAKLDNFRLLNHPFWAQALEWTFANNPGLGQRSAPSTGKDRA